MNEIEIKASLLKTISDSSLSSEDKELWNKSLSDTPFEIILAIQTFLMDYGDKLQEATEFLKQKINAAKSKDATAWNKIIKDEDLFLNNTN